jgi:hypothetical protein
MISQQYTQTEQTEKFTQGTHWQGYLPADKKSATNRKI